MTALEYILEDKYSADWFHSVTYFSPVSEQKQFDFVHVDCTHENCPWWQNAEMDQNHFSHFCCINTGWIFLTFFEKCCGIFNPSSAHACSLVSKRSMQNLTSISLRSCGSRVVDKCPVSDEFVIWLSTFCGASVLCGVVALCDVVVVTFCVVVACWVVVVCWVVVACCVVVVACCVVVVRRVVCLLVVVCWDVLGSMLLLSACWLGSRSWILKTKSKWVKENVSTINQKTNHKCPQNKYQKLIMNFKNKIENRLKKNSLPLIWKRLFSIHLLCVVKSAHNAVVAANYRAWPLCVSPLCVFIHTCNQSRILGYVRKYCAYHYFLCVYITAQS